jgi:hypothetical protein
VKYEKIWLKDKRRKKKITIGEKSETGEQTQKVNS